MEQSSSMGADREQYLHRRYDDRGRQYLFGWNHHQHGRPVGSAPLMRLGITQKGERACQKRDMLQSLAQRHSVFAQMSELVLYRSRHLVSMEGIAPLTY